jgi:hypothetical protein
VCFKDSPNFNIASRACAGFFCKIHKSCLFFVTIFKFFAIVTLELYFN